MCQQPSRNTKAAVATADVGAAAGGQIGLGVTAPAAYRGASVPRSPRRAAITRRSGTKCAASPCAAGAACEPLPAIASGLDLSSRVVHGDCSLFGAGPRARQGACCPHADATPSPPRAGAGPAAADEESSRCSSGEKVGAGHPCQGVRASAVDGGLYYQKTGRPMKSRVAGAFDWGGSGWRVNPAGSSTDRGAAAWRATRPPLAPNPDEAPFGGYGASCPPLCPPSRRQRGHTRSSPPCETPRSSSCRCLPGRACFFGVETCSCAAGRVRLPSRRLVLEAVGGA